MMADFQNRLISQIFSYFFLERFFAQNYSKTLLEWILTYFLVFLFFDQSDDFAKAIGFA